MPPTNAGPVLTSTSGRVKEARKLRRRSVRTERRLFLADGPKAVEGALEMPGCVVEVFATADALERYADLVAGEQVGLVDDRALASLSDAVNPQGLVAVGRFIDRPLEHVVDDPETADGQLVLCADVRDPGNAGTIIRTADAVAAHGVALLGNSVDPYNEKTVRATVGSLFHLPLSLAADAGAAVETVRRAGYLVLAADGGGEVDLPQASTDGLLDGRIAWLFGNEAWGLPANLAELADHRVRIPIPGRAESLNLSTAAAVCLYAGLSGGR